MRDSHEAPMGHVSHSTWLKWILDAIQKIRHQKQRPSVERISHAIRQHHKFRDECIVEQLELAVKEGAVLRVINKGQCSYKDPGVNSRQLKITKGTDLSKVIVKALRELGERGGSTLKGIERYIRQSHAVEQSEDVDLSSLLRLSVKRAVARGLVVQEGRLFRLTGRAPSVSVAVAAAAAAAARSAPSHEDDDDDDDDDPRSGFVSPDSSCHKVWM
ncbi:hypothetical protein J437_LFUL012345 [Ladona fulva]|uniref:Histone acetyltransferase n=1 Tax=Ladona fulva TaxID=123851 RepID=A0A8K0P6Q8_LADFU|nr:hypothetical protein J437_LFUL012345 [Ladona fulva]